MKTPKSFTLIVKLYFHRYFYTAEINIRSEAHQGVLRDLSTCRTIAIIRRRMLQLAMLNQIGIVIECGAA